MDYPIEKHSSLRFELKLILRKIHTTFKYCEFLLWFEEAFGRHYPVQDSSLCSSGSVPRRRAIALPPRRAGRRRLHLGTPVGPGPVLAGGTTRSRGQQRLRHLSIKQLAVLQRTKRLGWGRSGGYCVRQR